MKIAIWSDSAGYPSGFSRVTKQICEDFSSVGHELHLLGAFNSNSDPLGYTEYAVHYGQYDLARKVLSKIEPDILLLIGPTPTFAPIIQWDDFPKECICVLYSILEMCAPIPGLGKQLSVFQDKSIVFPTNFARDMWKPYMGGENSVVIPHGIELEKFKVLGDKVALREKWSRRFSQWIDSDSIVFFSIERNDPRKRLDLVCDFISRLQDISIKCQVIFHCHRKLDTGLDLEKTAFDVYGLDRRSVIFTDFNWRNGLNDNDIVELYNLSDYRISMSGGEGFGFGSLEAMACGCLNLVPRNTTFEEVCGESAVYFECTNRSLYNKSFLLGDPNVADAVTKFLRVYKNERAQNILRENGFSQVKKFSRENVSQAWLEYLIYLRSDEQKYENGFITKYSRANEFRILASLASGLAENNSIIDIGCGRGHLLDYLLRMSADAYGIECFENKPVSSLVNEFIYSGEAKSFVIDGKYRFLVASALYLFDEMSDGEVREVLKHISNLGVDYLLVENDTDLYSLRRTRINLKCQSSWDDLLASCGYFLCDEVRNIILEKTERLLSDFNLYVSDNVDVEACLAKVDKIKYADEGLKNGNTDSN